MKWVFYALGAVGGYLLLRQWLGDGRAPAPTTASPPAYPPPGYSGYPGGDGSGYPQPPDTADTAPPPATTTPLPPLPPMSGRGANVRLAPPSSALAIPSVQRVMTNYLASGKK